MKKIYLLAAMIVLTALNTFAQKFYTGTINFNKTGYVIDVDNAKTQTEKKIGADFIKKVVLQVYGKNALNMKLGEEEYQNAYVVGKTDDLQKWQLKAFDSSIVKKSKYIIYSLVGYKGAASTNYGYKSLINTDEKTAYDLESKKSLKLKI